MPSILEDTLFNSFVAPIPADFTKKMENSFYTFIIFIKDNSSF